MAVVERVKQQSMYGLAAKNIGRCGEVAVSGSSTVLAQLKCWQAAGHQATGSMFWREKPIASDTASTASKVEQSEAINLVPRPLVDESRR